MAYPVVTIKNSTNYKAHGTVEYASAFCRNNDYKVNTLDSWKAKGRGVCLVRKIKAWVETPNETVQASSYTSSGTSYSQFAIIDMGDSKFAVTRIITDANGEHGDDSFIPDDYQEPVEEQE